MDVIVAGGGIAGLTLALALHGRGSGCRVFSKAELRGLVERYKLIAGYDAAVLGASKHKVTA